MDRLEKNNIVKEVKDSFLEYSMSVIVSRALPDLRDGLKPVHRRILYSMYESAAPKTGQIATHTIPSNPTRKSQIWKSQPEQPELSCCLNPAESSSFR